MSLPESLSGILLPITTPFTSDEEIDSKGLQANLRFWNASGIVGYVVLGSTGERVNLDERECQEVIETARAEVPRELSFIIGAGQESRRGTINEIKRAAAAGADAVLVITPHFYRAAITQDALVEHYLAVADSSPVPVLLYSMPDLTGVRIEPETAAQLSQHPNIIGIKDSSAEVAKLRETIRLSPPNFAVLTGNGTVLSETLAAGARGGILAVACVATTMCLAIFRAVESRDLDRAAALQEGLTPLAKAVTTRFGIGGLKAALEMKRLAGGAVRAPLMRRTELEREEIRSCLEDAEQALEGSLPLVSAADD
ncbi:MAG: dihydrodipicolinate synthase family protein [Pyrinomonadaceae bacterium]